jgi:hypothetical protein
MHHPAAREHLAKDEQPERGLEGAGDEFGEIVAQFAQLKFGDDESLANEPDQRMDKYGRHVVGLSKPLFCCSFG